MVGPAFRKGQLMDRTASGLRPSVRPVESSASSLPSQPSSLASVGAVCHEHTISRPRKCTRDEGAAILSLALRNTMGVIGASVSDVAFWCDVDRRTVQRWINGDATVATECIVRSSRLWATFVREVSEIREQSASARRSA